MASRFQEERMEKIIRISFKVTDDTDNELVIVCDLSFYPVSETISEMNEMNGWSRDWLIRFPFSLGVGVGPTSRQRLGQPTRLFFPLSLGLAVDGQFPDHTIWPLASRQGRGGKDQHSVKHHPLLISLSFFPLRIVDS